MSFMKVVSPITIRYDEVSERVWNTIKLIILVSGSLSMTVALFGHRYRVLVSPDVGGTDPDDL